MNSIRDFYLAGLKPAAERLAATRPDIRPLFTPRLFPNYISGKRGFLGLLSRRPTSERRPDSQTGRVQAARAGATGVAVRRGLRYGSLQL